MNELNLAQKEAAETLDGPLLILAGAGAGKTRVIVERIGNLIKRGADPKSILAITFTNKAAKEMRDRVKAYLQKHTDLSFSTSGAMDLPFVSTFHAFGVNVLRENSERLNLPRHFKIFDRGDSKQAIKDALKERGFDPKEYDPNRMLSIISREKSSGVSLSQFEDVGDRSGFGKIVYMIWSSYEKILREEKALDFDDLLLKTFELLTIPEVLEIYRKKFKFIHVDEYQDTNHIQYLIANRIAGKDGNICVVGDIDQNIYSWRGARLKNILEFEKDHSNAKVVLLEENYRSSKTILDVANRVIQKNIYRKEKNLFTKNDWGEKISLYEAFEGIEEAEFVAGKCKELIEKGSAPEQIAVLYRANFQSRVLEEAFLSWGVKYQLLGTKFFERKEIKDMVSFIRASLDIESISDIKRIINVPARGIGKVSLLKIFEGKEGELSKNARTSWLELKSLLKETGEKLNSEKISDVLRFILEKTGLRAALEIGDEDDKERLENIYELVSFAVRFDENPGMEGVEKFLTEVALQSDQDELTEEKKGVKLMTIHAAKGLEFDYVFITGLEEGLFPHTRDENISEEDAEEERRLFYVAITRARKKIYLSFAQVRTIFGRQEVSMPSEFIYDVPEEHVVKEVGNYGLLGRINKPKKIIDF